MNILVTGSAGFVGKYMVKELRDHGHKVVPFDVVTGQDLLKPEDVNKIFLDFPIDVVCHLGAQAHLGRGEQDPITNAQVNIIGALNIFDAALKNGAAVIYHSTGAVYSDECPQPVTEDSPREPKSHYGVSKVCAEEYALFYVRRGLKLIRTRFSSVYGIGRDVAPVNVFTKKAVNKEHIQLFGPDITRDYTHVNDVTAGVRRLVEDLDPDRDTMCPPLQWNGQCFNVASGVETRTVEVLEMLERILRRKVDYEIMPAKKGDVMKNYFNVTKLRGLGWIPRVSLEDGVRELVTHYKVKKSNDQVITHQSGE